MKKELADFKRIDSEISELNQAKERLKVKANQLSRKGNEALARIERLEKQERTGLVENVKGSLSDAALDDIRAAIRQNQKLADDCAVKLNALEQAVVETEAEIKSVESQRDTRRIRFLMAAVDEKSALIPSKVRGLVSDIWSIRARCPGANRASFLDQLFPSERVEQQKERWSKFATKHDIE